MRARVAIVPYEIPLRIPMRTSAGSTDVRSGLFLRVRDEDHGIVGLGETAPLDSGELVLAREVIERARASSLEMEGASARSDGLLSRVAAAVEHWLGSDAP